MFLPTEGLYVEVLRQPGLAKFGSVLDKLKKQLNTASNTIDESGKRTRAMERRLREVEELPPDLAREVVGLVDEPAALLDNGDDEEEAEA